MTIVWERFEFTEAGYTWVRHETDAPSLVESLNWLICELRDQPNWRLVEIRDRPAVLPELTERTDDGTD